MSSKPRLTDEQVLRVTNTMIGTDMSLGCALTVCGHFLDQLHSADVGRCADAVKRCQDCRQWAARADVIDGRCRACWADLYDNEETS
jgi:hypothetical protein